MKNMLFTDLNRQLYRIEIALMGLFIFAVSF